jgi:predicted DNA-binding protein with PD1-like motif
MEWTRSGDDVFVRLDPGEEIHASLQGLADELGFDAAAITSGIGRTRQSTYGYMDDDHKYHRVTLEGGSELVTLQGNLARRKNGAAFTHLHATFSDDDLKPHAGHMFTATVHVVAEIHLRVLTHAIMTRCPLENSEFVALKFD